MTTEAELQAHVSRLAHNLAVPGVAVGVVIGDEDQSAFHGVTSIEDPHVVDAETLFQTGSTGKTYTATAIMQLGEQGRIDLDAPVRTYVPELRLKDEQVARDVTVRHLLNHPAGWDGDFFEDQGEGDDALDRYVRSKGPSDRPQAREASGWPSLNRSCRRRFRRRCFVRLRPRPFQRRPDGNRPSNPQVGGAYAVVRSASHG